MLQNQNIVSKIENIYYMQPIIKMFYIYSEKYGLAKCLNYLDNMIIDAKFDIKTLLNKRLNNKQIKNKFLA